MSSATSIRMVRPDVIATVRGASSFTATTPMVLGSRPKFLVVSDIDGDRDLDLGTLETGVTGQNARLWVALQSGTGTVDITPPGVQLIAPAAGAIVASTVTLAATPSTAPFNAILDSSRFHPVPRLLGEHHDG